MSRPYYAVLVEITTVATILRISRDSVSDWVDEGHLLHVWNIAEKGARSRVLRFDYGEVLRLQAGMGQSGESEEQVIARVIGHPHERSLHTETVAAMLCTTRGMVHWWLKSGELAGEDLVGHRQMVSRASLAEFLRGRWVR